MGSFDVGCAVSNLAIHEGDEIGFMLLRPKAHHSSESFKHRIYATDDFEPFLPPVYGEYGDYGDLVKIQESNVTVAIEEIFKRPADKVIGAIGTGRSYYDSYSPIYSLYMPAAGQNKPSWDAHESKTFELFGWTRITAPEGAIDAYSWRGYTAVKNKTRAVGPGTEAGIWSLLHGEQVLKEEIEASVNSPAEQITSVFAELTGLLPGYRDEDWPAIKLLSATHGMFFLKRVADEMIAAVESDRWAASSLDRVRKNLEKEFELDVVERLDELNAALKTRTYPESLLASLRSAFNQFPAIEKCLQLENPENVGIVQRILTVDDVLASELLISTMTRLNRMVQPSYCGSQFGEDRLSSKLNRVTDTILEERAKYYGDGEEDEG